MKHLEIRDITNKSITLRFKIDYDTGKASLLDSQNCEKRFLFAGRGLEYMNGWLDIIETMKRAVLEIKRELELDLAEKSKFKQQDIEEMEAKLLKWSIAKPKRK